MSEIADLLLTYIPIEVEQALIRYVKGESVWVRSKYEPDKWVRFKRSWNSPPLLDEVREKCGIWRSSELKEAFHIKQEIIFGTRKYKEDA
ncbi:hypothetical protein [Thermoactinomyces mirandus]|uniref:Uncharacterized protein n=1 Tax=Thermoactinomyces mirandus TaxID=2756294 RepID=A0A7W1XUH6_9BACL|nr:hypothetical protein [Thermoactinomyces mirandus]MBA4603519.1 hypothetical protein [Thermoactinomyces mirandus]